MVYRCFISISIIFYSAVALATSESVPVVSSLDLDALSPGQHHLYLRQEGFRGGLDENIPVMVLKGEEKGKRLMLTAAIHGDELNGIAVIHNLFARLDTKMLSGSIVAVPGVNQAGLEAGSRYYTEAPGAQFSDLNRAFSGGRGSAEATKQAAAYLWTHLFKDNADLAVDIHTQAEGAAYPLFVFADFSNPTVKQMAYAVLPDVIKVDSGHKGTLETAYMTTGIPAITLELGEPHRLNKHLVSRAVDGLINLMKRQAMLEGDSIKSAPVVGLSYTDVSAEADGFVVVQVPLLASVAEGEKVAVHYDPFGRELKVYYAPHAGTVLTVATVPMRKKGDMIVRIIQ